MGAVLSEFLERQPHHTVMTKCQRYGEIFAVLARHGIGVFEEEFIKA